MYMFFKERQQLPLPRFSITILAIIMCHEVYHPSFHISQKHTQSRDWMFSNELSRLLFNGGVAKRQ